MKTHKKTLSVILAAVMLCSGCNGAGSAAETTTAAETEAATTTTAAAISETTTTVAEIEAETTTATTTAAETTTAVVTTTLSEEEIAEKSKEMLTIEGAALISCDQEAVDIIIPEGVTVIQGDITGRVPPFYNCSKLKTVTLPDSIINVRENSFKNCGDVKLIYKGEEYSPDRIKELNEAITSLYIKDGTLIMGARGIETLEIPEGIKSVEPGAFFGSEKLKEIIIPESVEAIRGFDRCNGLTRVEIPSTVKKVDGFEECLNLKEVVIGEGVKEIGGFWGCTSLETINIPESVTFIGAEGFACCSSLKEIALPDSLREISPGAFSGCTGLTEIVIPGSVEVIDELAFQGCTGLSKVAINEGVQTIKFSAFKGCTGLTEITIPDSTVIWPDAFEGCTGLTVNYKGKAYTYDSFDEIYDMTVLDWTGPGSWGYVSSYMGCYYQYKIEGENQ